MFIATLSFAVGSTLYRAGDEVPNPSDDLIAAGLVKEAKVQKAEETKALKPEVTAKVKK